MKRKKIVKKKKAKKTSSKGRGLMLVQSPVAPEAKFFVASEMADDELIANELLGKVVDFYIYHFEQDGKDVYGLTVKGVNEVVRQLNKKSNSGLKIRVKPEFLKIERDVVQDGQKGVSVSVYAENLLDGNGSWGSKFEPYLKTKRGGGTYKNTFPLEKALSKAERNAKRKLIPEVMAIEMIKKLSTNTSNVLEVQPPKLITETVIVEAPKPSAPDVIKNNIVQAISKCNNVEQLADVRKKIEGSDKFSDNAKKALFALIDQKVKKGGL